MVSDREFRHQSMLGWADSARFWRAQLLSTREGAWLVTCAIRFTKAVDWTVRHAKAYREAWEAERWDQVAREERENVHREEIGARS